MQLPLHQTARTNEHVCTPVRLLCPAATLHRAVARAALDQRFTLSAVPTCQHADAPTSPKRNGPEICAAASFVPWQRLLYRLCVFVCPAVVRAHRCHVCCAQIPQSRSVALGRAHSARGPLACSSSRHARCGTTRCKGADAYEHSASLTAAKHTQVPRTRRRRTQSPRRTARRRGRTTT